MVRTDPSARDWSLFVDWCSAFEMDPWDAGPEEVLAYAHDLPAAPGTLARRLRAVATRVGWRQLGLEEPAGRGARVPGSAPAWREREQYATGADPAWLSLSEALSRCPVSGWPRAYRGRRDAWLLVLLAPLGQGGAGLSRAEALSVCGQGPDGVVLNPDDERGQVVSVRGQAIASTAADGGDPLRCPACAVVRWCEVSGLVEFWLRSGASERLTRARDLDGEHACLRDLVGHERDWPKAVTLAPGIDQHGWNLLPTRAREDGTYERFSMSMRSVSEMLARRCSRLAPLPEPVVEEIEANPWDDEVEEAQAAGPDEQSESGPGEVARFANGRPRIHAGLTLEALFDTLEDRMDSTDEANARITAILDETDEMVAGLGKALRSGRSEKAAGAGS